MLSTNFLSINLNNILIVNCPSDVGDWLKNQFQTHQPQLQHVESVVLTLHGEASDPTTWQHGLQNFINSLVNYNPKLKIILVFNSWYKMFKLEFNFIDEIVYLDFFLFRTYYETVITNSLQVANHWDPTEEKILLLIGRRFIRFHRLRLLYKLLNKGLEQQLTWSLVRQSTDRIQDCVAYIPELTEDEMEVFLKNNCRDLDNNVPVNGGPQTVRFKPELYQHSIFQIVAETDFDRCWPTAWITEKTWTSIANKRPFIIAGNVNTMAKLTNMGFRTFQDYLKIPNYDDPSKQDFLLCRDGKIFQSTKSKLEWATFYQQVKDEIWPANVEYDNIDQLPEQVQQELLKDFRLPIETIDELRLEAIVENVSDLLLNIHKFEQQVKDDVEYNYNRFVELGKENLCKITDTMSRYGLSGTITDFMLITTL